MQSKKIIDFETSSYHYQGAPCLVWCFDDRFHNLLERFRQSLGLEHIDVVGVAGGAKDLASPDAEHKRQTLLWEIEASLKLHQAPWIGLMVHSDCGAYGKEFNSEKEGKEFYVEELKKAEQTVRNFLEKTGSQIKIRKYYADFTGLYEVD